MSKLFKLFLKRSSIEHDNVKSAPSLISLFYLKIKAIRKTGCFHNSFTDNGCKKL